MEQNFSLFWGLAIQEYESLLISDDSPFDRARNGNPAAMSEQARAGENVFMTKGQCINCHMGPLFSGATVTKSSTSTKAMEHMRVGNGAMAFYDKGYYNIGVRPSAEDIGVGATDPYGFDLSFSRQYKWRQLGRYSRGPDNFDAGACSWQFQFLALHGRTDVDGSGRVRARRRRWRLQEPHLAQCRPQPALLPQRRAGDPERRRAVLQSRWGSSRPPRQG